MICMQAFIEVLSFVVSIFDFVVVYLFLSIAMIVILIVIMISFVCEVIFFCR